MYRAVAVGNILVPEFGVSEATRIGSGFRVELA